MTAQRTHISLIVVILISILLAVATSAVLFFIYTVKGKSAPTIKEAKQLYTQGKPDIVIESLEKMEPAKAGTSESLLLYGKSFYLRALKQQRDTKWRDYGKNEADWFGGSDVDNAMHYLKRAQQDSLTYNEASLYLAIIYMEKGWYEQSQQLFEQILQIDSIQQETILNYGVLLSRMQKFTEAESMLIRGTKAHPKFPQYWENLFWLYALHTKENNKAVIAGDNFLKLADKNDIGGISVRTQLTEILARFPELSNESMVIVKERARQFEPRKFK